MDEKSGEDVDPECDQCHECKVVYDGESPMIQCDCCDHWYHNECENVVSGEEDESEWHCSCCRKTFTESEKAQKTDYNESSNEGKMAKSDFPDRCVALISDLNQFCDYLMKEPINENFRVMIEQCHTKLGTVLSKYNAGKNVFIKLLFGLCKCPMTL